MKKWIAITGILLIALLVIMFITKPSEERYNAWLIENISNRLDEQSPMAAMGISLFGEQLIENNTEVEDYVIFNTFETKFQEREMKFIGVFNVFIPLSV
ncbi:DUF4359 domain-containing protein [Jeotgalibacillus sp. ET6]|uniref:DUF4359 domain-containing protein n=1 Tax=Jeotgalibacillus sp. ET6 TaxID=3037260 RepID=UPI0024187FD5|nr:DUF4359 domain-containing protein [Jeotgalibacillus sp. ET6]MDG5473150.1 DUF4359 domain-containing protein [Jeotgalibacillus sp. ET6]